MNSFIRSIVAHSHALASLTLGALALIAARPLWNSAAFFDSDDGMLHLLRVYALDREIQQGTIYPRWLMDLAFGYGYPIFNFYPPLAEFLAETIHLSGFDFATAIEGVMLVTILIAISGAYALGQELFSGDGSIVAGVLTAAAYVFFPYFMSDIYVRGATAEGLAAAILPWTVWSLRRVVRTRERSIILLLAVLLAAMLLAHSLTILICAPAFLIYFLVECKYVATNQRVWALARAMVAGGLSIGLGAFYWLPFVMDLSSVRMGRGIYAIQDAFQSNFLSLDRLIQLDFFYHYYPAPTQLGIVTLSIALLSFLFIICSRSSERGRLLYFGMLAVIGALLMVEQTRDPWLMIPFATMIQYPWRVSILIGLGIAVLVGSLPQSVSTVFKNQRRLPRGVVATLSGTVLVWSAMFYLDPQPLYLSGDSPTLGQLSRMEAYTGSLGTTTWGEYLPNAVKPVNLLNFRANVPSAFSEEIRLLEYSPYRQMMKVSAKDPFTLTLRTLYNPAWRVQIDGRTMPVFPNTPMSLLATAIPAGDHQIRFDLLEGPAQTIGYWLSGSTLSLLLVLLVLWRHESHAKWVLASAILISSSFAVPAFVAMRASPQELQPIQLAVSPSVKLVGLKIENAHIEDNVWSVKKANSFLHLTAFWQVQRSLRDQPVAWRLVDASGGVKANGVQLPRYGTGIAAGWIPNEIVQDEYDVPFQGLGPGRYSLEVSWDPKEFTTVSSVILGQTAFIPQAVIENHVNARVGEQIRLLGYNAPSSARPGERILITLFWRADKNVSTDYTAFIQLLDAEGNAVARPKVDTPPGGGLAFTSLWNPGETVTDRVEINLPADLRPGIFHLIAGLYHYPDLDRLEVLDENGNPIDDYVLLGRVQISR